MTRYGPPHADLLITILDHILPANLLSLKRATVMAEPADTQPAILTHPHLCLKELHTALWMAVEKANYDAVAAIVPRMDLAQNTETTGVRVFCYT